MTGERGTAQLWCKRITQARKGYRAWPDHRCTARSRNEHFAGSWRAHHHAAMPLVSRSREVRDAVSLLTGKKNAVDSRECQFKLHCSSSILSLATKPVCHETFPGVPARLMTPAELQPKWLEEGDASYRSDGWKSFFFWHCSPSRSARSALDSADKLHKHSRYRHLAHPGGTYVC